MPVLLVPVLPAMAPDIRADPRPGVASEEESGVTLHHKQMGAEQARCQKCDHDLIVKKGSAKDGAVYCSNRQCSFTHRPHPTPASPNKGRA